MATVQDIVTSVEVLLGNRRDVRDACLIAVQDAIRVVKGMFPSPEQQIIVDIEFAQGDHYTALPSTIESVSACSYYSLGDPALVADGTWTPLEKGNPTTFLTYPDEPMPPLKWFQFGRDLWIWPAHDITTIVDVPNPTPPPATIPTPVNLIVRAIGTTEATYALGSTVPVNEIQIVAVRELALAQMKVWLGQPEVGQSIRSFVKNVVQPAMSMTYRNQQHGHTGLKPYLE